MSLLPLVTGLLDLGIYAQCPENLQFCDSIKMDSKTHRYAELIQLSDAAHSYVTRRNETGMWERPTSHA